MLRSWLPRDSSFSELTDFLQHKGTWVQATAANQLPQDLVDWLSRLYLMYGVPFNYIIPDEQMLPIESIRFFYIDPNWVLSIMDGAFSIGRNTGIDHSHDAEMLEGIQPKIIDNNKNIRRILQGLSPKVSRTDGKTASYTGPYTGFFLRSTLVSGWAGLEVIAYDKPEEGTGNPLPILRMERLADDVLLCIFEGIAQRVEFPEPPENLHFGADLSGGIYSKILRKVDSGVLNDKKKISPLPMRDGRVVKVAELVDEIREKLGANNFTSAEFALEMIENAHNAVIILKG